MGVPQILSVDDEHRLRLGVFDDGFKDLVSVCEVGHLLLGSHAGLRLRRRLSVLLALDEGLRLAELTGLLWEDITIPARSRGFLVVRGSLNHSNRSRRVPLTELVDDSLRRIAGGLRKTELFVASARVLGRVGPRSPLNKRTVGRWIRSETGRVLGVAIRPHALRHTFATRLLRVADIRVVQELLGHATLGATQIYCHVNEDDLRAAVDKRAMAS